MNKSFHLIKPYFIKHRLRIIFGLSCLMAVDFMQLYIPRVVKQAVDGLTVYQADLTMLLRCALIILILAVGIGCLRYVWRRCLIGLSIRVEEGLRNRLFSHLQTLSASYYDRTPTGDLMARATNDIKQVRMATGMGLVAVTDATVLGVAAIGFMAYINVQLTFFLLIPMPAIVLTAKFFGKKMHRRYQDVQAGFSTMTETVREFFAGIRMIKVHNRQPETTRRFEKVSDDYIRLNLKLVRITRTFIPLMIFFSNLSLAVVIFLGGRQTITATITPGEFVAFIAYVGLLTWPMMALGWLTNLIQRGRASLDRIDAVIRTRPDIRPANQPDNQLSPKVAIPVKIQGALTLSNIAFHYPSGNQGQDLVPVLNGIDLSVLPGETVGVVGPPGSGKTTLLNLIPRLYDVSSGVIRIGGTDIRRMDPDHLREHIVFVPQEPFLFSGTIYENIVFSEKVVDEKKLAATLEAAALDQTIDMFDDGLDTLVGEKGVILSGGQKQRVALARALFHDVPVLLLDDPISQVDIQTADTIIRSLRRLKGRRTIVMVSHRLSALQYVDRIIVLENGCVTEVGTHEQLVATAGYYARTAAIQALNYEKDHHGY
ncbi:MAG: ABC transporter ATP-binding protein [Thermodesulfobacteriota bacterium]|nr:ABC transporter ATP-binding protein [Thermodesulfobacteriota bacterium]